MNTENAGNRYFLASIESQEQDERLRESVPQWRDRPTEPGRWIKWNPGFSPAKQLCDVVDEDVAFYEAYPQDRWYGPIPEDTD